MSAMTNQPVDSVGVMRRGAGVPLYVQLERLFTEKITAGAWKEGMQLPSERELCDLFQVSRITVRHAIALAESKGLLTRVQGVGTFVAARKYEQTLSEVRSFEKSLAQLGLVATTAIHSAGSAVGELWITGTLRLAAAVPVCNLQLVGSGDGRPLVFYDSYFPADIGRRMVAAAQKACSEGIPFSTLELYAMAKVSQPTRIEQTLEAMVADERLSSLLKVDEGAPILQITSVVSTTETPVEYRRAFYRGDKYKFAMERSLADMV